MISSLKDLRGGPQYTQAIPVGRVFWALLMVSLRVLSFDYKNVIIIIIIIFLDDLSCVMLTLAKTPLVTPCGNYIPALVNMEYFVLYCIRYVGLMMWSIFFIP